MISQKKLGIEIIYAKDSKTTYTEYYAACGKPVRLVDDDGIRNCKLTKPTPDDISKYKRALSKIGIEYNEDVEIWGVNSFDC